MVQQRLPRRRVLGGSAAALLTGLAGCVAVPDDRFSASVGVSNETATRHTGRLVVDEPETDVVHVEQSLDIPAGGNSETYSVTASDRLRLVLDLDGGGSRTTYWAGSCPEATLQFVINGPTQIAYMAPACD
jgi:type IV pilus biogenesis protein CpaD/CtpE